jgi:hypothetical protein
MADSVVVKQPLTSTTLTTAGGVAGGFALGPQMVQPIIEYFFQLLTWVWPTIPVPSILMQFSMANWVLAAAAFALIMLNRPKETLGELKQRVEDVKAVVAADVSGA